MTRTVVSLTGPDRVAFLQDLVTNDVTRPDRLTYTALLTPQGKYLFDFFVSHDGDALLLDVPADMAEALAQRLSIYRLRRKVDITATDAAVSRGIGAVPTDALPDPRHPDLGWRKIGIDSYDTADWDALRVRMCVPESGIELIQNDSFPLEMGLDRLNGIDFRKGCYVGQEVTARMKHKTELKKGLRRVAIDQSVPVGTPITADGKPAGTLYTQSDGAGLAWLRFDRANGDMTAGEATLRLAET